MFLEELISVRRANMFVVKTYSNDIMFTQISVYRVTWVKGHWVSLGVDMGQGSHGS